MKTTNPIFLLYVLCWMSFAQAETILLTIGYCPKSDSSKGAIVTIDTASNNNNNQQDGNFTIRGTFEWPSEAIFGCLYLYSPSVEYVKSSNDVYLDFANDFGEMLTLSTSAPPHVSRNTDINDPFFDGFTSFYYVGNAYKEKSVVVGLAPTVTENGYCDDGCFEFGVLNTLSGNYKRLNTIPFKAIEDDLKVVSGSLYYTQGSYDLRDKTCAPSDTDECLLAISMDTGTLQNAVYTNYSIFKFGQASADGKSVIALIEAEEDHGCNDEEEYIFGMIDLETADMQVESCLDRHVVLQTDEWIASFSQDGTQLVTGSGDTDGENAQVVVFDVASGKVTLDTTLQGLGRELKAFGGLFDIWACDFEDGN